MINDFLFKERGYEKASFHMPGHKGAKFFEDMGYKNFIKHLVDFDITEIPGADNLHSPHGIIKNLMAAYAVDYGVSESFLLINGSTCGIIASILATVKQGSKLLMARNCHRSVYSALELGSIEPVYLSVKEFEDSGIMGTIDISDLDRCLNANEDIGSMILPSPNYYGVCSDIRTIVSMLHKRGIPLIVDQAHGAHLNYFDKYESGFLPESAEKSGADIVINSTHKTLASFTQSAILNLQGDLVDRKIISEKLQLVESTSPSYLLMASLDSNCEILREHGKKLFAEWKNNLERFYERIKHLKEYRIIRGKGLDFTKINISAENLGINGQRLEKLLNERNVVAELATGNILMCMTGIGNTWRDYEKLLEALKDIRNLHNKDGVSSVKAAKGSSFKIPKSCCKLPRCEWENLNKVWVDLEESEGRISAGAVIPYPPGIPWVLEGEIISKEIIKMLKETIYRGEYICGIENNKLFCYE